MTADPSSPSGHPRRHGRPATGVPARPDRLRRARHRLGLLRGARRRRGGAQRQAAQGPLPPRLLRRARGRLRGRLPRLPDLPRARPDPGLARGHRRHGQPRPRARRLQRLRHPRLPRRRPARPGPRAARPADRRPDRAAHGRPGRAGRRAGPGHRRHRHPRRLRPGRLRPAGRARASARSSTSRRACSSSPTASTCARSTCPPSCRSSPSTSSARRSRREGAPRAPRSAHRRLPDEPGRPGPVPPHRAPAAARGDVARRRPARAALGASRHPAASNLTEAIVVVHLQPHRGLRRVDDLPRRRHRHRRGARPTSPGVAAATSCASTSTSTTRTAPSRTPSRWPAAWTRWPSARRQILGQMRDALRDGQRRGQVGRALNSLFQQALRVGKRAHAETGIDRGQRVAGRGRAGPRRARRSARCDGLDVLVVGAGGDELAWPPPPCPVSAPAADHRQPHPRQGRAGSPSGRRWPRRAARPSWRRAGRGRRGDLLHRRRGLVVDLDGAARRRRSPAPAAPRSTSTWPCRTTSTRPRSTRCSGVERRRPGRARRASCPAARRRPQVQEVADLVIGEVAAYLTGAPRPRPSRPTVAALRSQAADVVAGELTRLDQRLPDLDEPDPRRGPAGRAPRRREAAAHPDRAGQGARRSAAGRRLRPGPARAVRPRPGESPPCPCPRSGAVP